MANKKNSRNSVERKITNTVSRKAKTTAKKVAKSHPKLVLVVVILLIVVAVLLYFGYKHHKPQIDELLHLNGNQEQVQSGDAYNPEDIENGDLSIHFIELSNYYTGDCTLIKKGDTEILIDAGAKTSNIDAIDTYIGKFCTDKKLEYVVVTHAHEDHYAGFSTENSLFNRYQIGTIIEFAQITSEKSSQAMYQNYVRERNEAVESGAICYTAKECRENNNYVFTIDNQTTFTVLDSFYYYNVSTTENDHSVCTLLTYKTHNYLFTGDLEKKGEEKLVELNTLPKVDVFKAGHHGSKTSSNDCLLSVIEPKVVCVCCCCGSSEYTKTEDNKFPTQDFIDRVAPYTRQVYITTMVVSDEEKTYQSMNGNIVILMREDEMSVRCSNNQTVLMDTDWFKNKRVMPDAWKQ